MVRAASIFLFTSLNLLFLRLGDKGKRFQDNISLSVHRSQTAYKFMFPISSSMFLLIISAIFFLSRPQDSLNFS